MEFKPKSESELKEAMLAPVGDYDFDVLSAEDGKSKKGNAMITVKIGLYRGDAISNHVYDYLLAQMEAKLRHFCDTTGLLSAYEAGTLTARDCVGKSGRVKIVVKEADGQYQAKNEVKDYICRPAKALSAPAEESDDSDVPF